MAEYNGDTKVILTRLDALTRKIDRIEGKVDQVCDSTIRHDEIIKTNKKEIENLRKKTDVWNAGNTLGILVASVLSAFGIHEAGS